MQMQIVTARSEPPLRRNRYDRLTQRIAVFDVPLDISITTVLLSTKCRPQARSRERHRIQGLAADKRGRKWR